MTRAPGISNQKAPVPRRHWAKRCSNTASRRKRKAALAAEKAAAAKLEKELDSKGLPKVNLFRFLPQQEKKATRSTDGSFVFPKPWGNRWGA